VDTAPKVSGCFLGGTQEIFGGVSEDLLGGTGKAEAATLPGAGIGPKQWPGKCAAEMRAQWIKPQEITRTMGKPSYNTRRGGLSYR